MSRAFFGAFGKRCHVQIWCLRQKMLRTYEGRISRAQSALEQLYQNLCTNTREAGGLPAMKVPSIDPAHKRWYELIAFFCMSLFVASGNAPELFEPIDEALSTVTFLVNLAIEPTPSVVLGSYRGG